MRRAVFRHRVPKVPPICFDCNSAIVDGPPYERVIEAVAEYDGDTSIVSHNLCRHCWRIHVWQMKDVA